MVSWSRFGWKLKTTDSVASWTVEVFHKFNSKCFRSTEAGRVKAIKTDRFSWFPAWLHEGREQRNCSSATGGCHVLQGGCQQNGWIACRDLTVCLQRDVNMWGLFWWNLHGNLYEFSIIFQALQVCLVFVVIKMIWSNASPWSRMLLPAWLSRVLNTSVPVPVQLEQPLAEAVWSIYVKLHEDCVWSNHTCMQLCECFWCFLFSVCIMVCPCFLIPCKLMQALRIKTMLRTWSMKQPWCCNAGKSQIVFLVAWCLMLSTLTQQN